MNGSALDGTSPNKAPTPKHGFLSRGVPLHVPPGQTDGTQENRPCRCVSLQNQHWALVIAHWFTAAFRPAWQDFFFFFFNKPIAGWGTERSIAPKGQLSPPALCPHHGSPSPRVCVSVLFLIASPFQGVGIDIDSLDLGRDRDQNFSFQASYVVWVGSKDELAGCANIFLSYGTAHNPPAPQATSPCKFFLIVNEQCYTKADRILLIPHQHPTKGNKAKGHYKRYPPPTTRQ
jgi:hypothetical protein